MPGTLSRRVGGFRNQTDRGEQLATLLMFMGAMLIEQATVLLDKSPIEGSDEAYWNKSIHPKLFPNPRAKQQWQERTGALSEGADMFLGMVLKDTQVSLPQDWNKDRPKGLSRLMQDIQNYAEKLKAEGKLAQSAALGNALQQMRETMGPNQELLKWIQLAVRWAPFLDSHAVRARYPKSPSDRLLYRQGVKAVANLVAQADEIMKQSKGLLSYLSSNQ